MKIITTEFEYRPLTPLEQIIFRNTKEYRDRLYTVYHKEYLPEPKKEKLSTARERAIAVLEKLRNEAP